VKNKWSLFLLHVVGSQSKFREGAPLCSYLHFLCLPRSHACRFRNKLVHFSSFEEEMCVPPMSLWQRCQFSPQGNRGVNREWKRWVSAQAKLTCSTEVRMTSGGKDMRMF
jgi:hypothetical protein